MAGVEFKTTGIAALKERLGRLPDALEDRLSARVQDAASTAVRDLQAMFPRVSRTGTVAGATRMEMRGRTRATVVNTDFRAGFLEHGFTHRSGTKVAGQRIWRRVVSQARDEMWTRVNDDVAAAARDAGLDVS